MLMDEALLLQSRIAQLKHPQPRVLVALRYFFKIPYPIIHGKAKDFLDDKKYLLAIKSLAETDYMSDFLRRHLGRTASSPILFCELIRVSHLITFDAERGCWQWGLLWQLQ